MKIYNYDQASYYLGESQLNDSDKNPVRPDEYIIPANATTTKPPEEKEKYRLKFDGSKWDYEEIPQPEDKEGYEVVWNSEKQEYEYQQLPLTLEQVKKNKKDSLNADRERIEQGGFWYDGKLIQSNIASAIRIANVAVEAERAIRENNTQWSIDWRTEDNTTITLTAQKFLEMQTALTNHSEYTLYIAVSLKEQVDKAATIEEVEAITWPDGASEGQETQP